MRLVQFLVLTPVAALLLAFGFANREVATIHFDPTDAYASPVTVPQYLALFTALAVGIVCGAAATWVGQRRYRRAARAAEAEAAGLRDELTAARAARPALAVARRA